MPDERKRLMMQEALDDVLSHDEQIELFSHLDTDAEDAAHYTRLQQVDSLLRTAPYERAPRRLALTIMARLGESMKQEQKLRLTDSPELSEAAMQVALQLVTVATLPMLIGASYLLLNAMSDPAIMETVLQQVAALYILVIDVMKVMLEQAQEVYKDNPEAAIALLALMPVTLLKLVEIVLGYEDDET